MALSNRYKGQRSVLTLSDMLPWLIMKQKIRLYGTLRVKMLTQESGIVKEKQQENDIVKNLKEMEL